MLPADGVPTSGNFVVTVTGTNFLETPRVLRCVFYSGDLVFFESRATRVSATELTCLTPVIGNGADLWTEVLVTGNDQPYGGTAPVNVTYYDCTSGILTCQDCAAAGDLCGWCSTPTSASCLGNTASCPVWETCSAAETTAAPGGNSDDGLVVDESPTDSSMVPLLVGAGAGGCCLILLVALLVFFCCCRRGGNKFGDEFGNYATDLDDDATVVAKQVCVFVCVGGGVLGGVVWWVFLLLLLLLKNTSGHLLLLFTHTHGRPSHAARTRWATACETCSTDPRRSSWAAAPTPRSLPPTRARRWWSSR